MTNTVRQRNIVHPESFRPNVQNAIAFARRNRPRINRSGEFACIYLRLCVLFAIERVHVRACDRAYVNSI